MEYAAKKRVTRRECVWAQIEQLVPWQALLQLIEPVYPKDGKRGRRPVGCERMLRMYIAQQCLGLSDEGMEDAVYDSVAVRNFVGVDLGQQAVPDATTLLKFRHLLQQHGLTQRILALINEQLSQRGVLLRAGTVVDATLMAAPSSTKNRTGQRDPEMHPTRKGNPWHFGMKVHVGVDAETGLVHSVVTTPANVSDVTQAHALLHGQESDVFADAGYRGVDKRAEVQAQHPAVNWHVAMMPSKRKALDKGTLLGSVLDALERTKAHIRAKGEHVFYIIKNIFGLKKVRYRGLAANTAQLYTLLALANLLLAKRWLLGTHTLGAS
ncbi:IS5 family transposase [Tepidimonas ignava]|nr:IS5 family transposase [Tepidimonas ignava]